MGELELLPNIITLNSTDKLSIGLTLLLLFIEMNCKSLLALNFEFNVDKEATMCYVNIKFSGLGTLIELILNFNIN